MSYVNADGLYVLTNQDKGAAREQGITTEAAKRYFVLDIEDMTELSALGALPPQENDAYIPAGSYITNAVILVKDACTSGGAATFSVGLQTRAGVAIDADGIDAAVALAALGANKAVTCDGDLVAGTATVGAENAYISYEYGTAAYDGGAVKIVIEYITPNVGKDTD